MSCHIFDGTLPFSCKKFKKRFWPVQLLENAPFTKKQFVKSLFQSWQKLFWLDGWSIYNFHSIQFYLLMVAIIGDNQTWYFSIFNENIIATSIAVCFNIFVFEYWENIENFICFFCWNCISTEIDFELQ